MPVVQRHRDGLRRDDAAELRVAGELLIPVQRVGVVHRHHPAADVGGAARIPQLAAADGLADPRSTSVRSSCGPSVGGNLRILLCHGPLPNLRQSAVHIDDDASAHLAGDESRPRPDRAAERPTSAPIDIQQSRIEVAGQPVPRGHARRASGTSRCRCPSRLNAAQDERHDRGGKVPALGEAAGGDRAAVLGLRAGVGQRVAADRVDHAGPAFLLQGLARLGQLGAVDEVAGAERREIVRLRCLPVEATTVKPAFDSSAVATQPTPPGVPVTRTSPWSGVTPNLTSASTLRHAV